MPDHNQRESSAERILERLVASAERRDERNAESLEGMAVSVATLCERMEGIPDLKAEVIHQGEETRKVFTGRAVRVGGVIVLVSLLGAFAAFGINMKMGAAGVEMETGSSSSSGSAHAYYEPIESTPTP